jgi:hypothetical protein
MGEKVDAIVWFVGWIMPTDSTPEKMHAWARRFASVSLVFVVGICFMFAAGYDLIPGVDGFARQSEIRGFNTSLGFLQKQSIEQAIDTKIKLRCLSSNGDAREDLSADIQRLEDKYFALTGGHGYPQPSCYEAGVSNQ